MLEAEKYCFPNSMAQDDIKKHVGVICNAPWYLDGNQHKITERVVHGDAGPIPERFT